MGTNKYFIAALVVTFILIGVLYAFAGKGHKHIPDENLAVVGPQLAKQFTFEPFNPPLPTHVWMKVDKGHVRFLHFNKPVTEKGAKLIFIGEGVKGKFCADDQPDKGKTGFVHFHSIEKPAGAKHGHGGHAGGEGYWLRHIAVGKFEMKGTEYTPGIAHNFTHTDPPLCN
jgi:hypothetical protein